MDQNQERRRGHFHRGRRGPDRRGLDRRNQQQVQGQGQGHDQERQNRDHVDVEQIMRDIRSRIAQRQGIDLSNHQIQDLAARRLESILDPRAMKPSLLEGLRKGAAAVAAAPPDKVPNEPAYSFEDTTIYDSHRALMRFVRRLMNPLLKLFFNPNPLIRALHLQAQLNVDAAKRETDRDRRQTEWNALHYEILQRLVTDISRASLELQALSLRVESLSAKIDFNERRVRSIEGLMHRARPQPPQGRAAEPAVAGPAVSEVEVSTPESATAEGGIQGEGARRRRRRRRGRRGGAGGDASSSHMGTPPMPAGPAVNEIDAETPPTQEAAQPPDALVASVEPEHAPPEAERSVGPQQTADSEPAPQLSSPELSVPPPDSGPSEQ
jgi:hypothetical protein